MGKGMVLDERLQRGKKASPFTRKTGWELMRWKGASEVVDTAVSAGPEGLPSALDSSADAGPSRATVSVKRKYEVDVADREFCRKVCLDITFGMQAEIVQLRAEEIELRSRNSVLRTSNGGKVNVSCCHWTYAFVV